MIEKTYSVVDAFTAEAFAGNAAAVVFEADGLGEDQMQSIAAEFHLSETTFVFSSDTFKLDGLPERSDALLEGVRFRWFTPTTEVDMCGHATIAGVHALVESGRMLCDEGQAGTPLRIETKSGVLSAFVEALPGRKDRYIIWLELILPTLAHLGFEEHELAAALQLPDDTWDRSIPGAKTQDGDGLVFVKDVALLNEARPHFDQLTNWLDRNRLRGLSLATVHTLTPSIHVQSRFFAPSVGVAEDPVTGSVHGPLAVHLAEQGLVPMQDGIAAMQCVQGIPGGRTGLVWALVYTEGGRASSVRIGGQAVTSMRGTLLVPGPTASIPQ